MNRPIWLELSEPKCTASRCSMPTPCARRDVAQDKGRPRADFSVSIGYGPAECMGPMWRKHIPLSQAVKPVQERQAKEWIGS